MCNNVILLLLSFVLTQAGDTFRLFSSDAGTYKEARPFFTSSKHLVEDYFDGNLLHASTAINANSLTFVMYYANFCGISRRMREPFEKAAAFYRERIQIENNTRDKFHVKFVAIDCFHHAGSCRKSYQLNYYPHMLLYIKASRGYQYFGPAVLSNLIEFIEKIRFPVIRLTNRDEFFDFILQHESSILARFDLSDPLQRHFYSIYVQTALKHIEYDNEHPIRFAVVLNQTIENDLFELTGEKFVTPYIFNHQFDSKVNIFPNFAQNLTVENLFQWILREQSSPQISWIVPKNRYFSRSPSIDKSTMFNALENNENLLIFFTPNRFDEIRLRHLFISLGNCNITHSNLWLNQLEKLYRRLFDEKKQNLTKIDDEQMKTCCDEILNRLSMIDLYRFCLSTEPSINFDSIDPKSCLSIIENSQCHQHFCQNWLRFSASLHRQDFDDQYEILLEKRREKYHDELLRQFDFEDLKMSEEFRGFLCRINTTWSFRLIDSRLYPQYLTNLGVNPQSRTILVLQAKNEQQYMLTNDQLNTNKICQLISDISHHRRSRLLVSVPLTFNSTEHSNRLIELTSDTFHSTVFNTNKHVLVIYYTKWCGFCRSVWPIIYQVKEFFRNFNNLIFTRIQADKQDLPWHLTVFTYPTLILFPSPKKSDSIVYPSGNESLTSVDLIRFLLYHLYTDRSVEQASCQARNNSFLNMLSSSYVDFSQLSSVIQSFS